MRNYIINSLRAVVILANVLLPLQPVVAYAASATDNHSYNETVAPVTNEAPPFASNTFQPSDELLTKFAPQLTDASPLAYNANLSDETPVSDVAIDFAPPANLTLSQPDIINRFGSQSANPAPAIAASNPTDNLLPAWFELPTTGNTDISLGDTGQLLPAWFNENGASGDAVAPAMPIAPRNETAAVENTIIPQISVDVEAPANVSEGDFRGDVYTITVTNGSATTAFNFHIEATIPTSGFIYTLGSATMTGPSGIITFTEGYTDPLVVWTPNNPFDLGAGQSVTLVFEMTTDDTAVSGQRLDVNAVYESQGSPGTNNGGANITVGRGNLVISKSPSNQDATFGDVVSWDVEVANTGLGDVFSTTVNDIIGAGFANPDFSQIPGTIPVLAIGERVNFAVTATVNSCYSLTNIAESDWSIGNEDGTGTTTAPISDTTDVTYLLSPPNLSLTSNSLAFDYCSPVADTVVVTVTNSGGAATNFVLESDVNGQPFNVSNVSAGWEYNSSNGEFTPTGGVMTSTTRVLTFDVTPTFNVCGSNDGSISFNARFTDPCDLPFPGSSTAVDYTYANGELPSLSVSKSANTGVTYTGDDVTFTVSFNANNTQNINGSIVITDFVSTPFSVTNIISDVAGSTLIQSGNAITWIIPSGAQASLSGNLTINAHVLDANNGVCAANSNADNTAYAQAPVTCAGCPDLTSSDSTSMIVQNAPVGNIDKTITSDGQICGILNIANTYALSITNWNNIVFTETLGFRDSIPNLEYMTGTLQVLVNTGGTNYAVNATIVQTTPQLILDLSGLTAAGAPTGTVDLEIDYDIFAPDPVLSGVPARSFFDWSELYVPGSGAQSCTDDDTFYQGVWVNLQRADLQVAIDPGTTVGCVDTTVTLTVSDPNLDAPDNLVANNIVVTYTVGSPDFDTIDWGSMSYGGGFSAASLISIVTGSNTITWIFRDPLTDTGTTAGTISFGMTRSCAAPPMHAEVSFDDRCGVNYTNTTDNTAAVAHPDLHLFVTPDTYTLNEQSADWDINVYNGGGLAHRVLVTDVIGSGLAFNTYTATVTGGTATVNLVSMTGGVIVWEILNLQSGTLVKMDVLADLVGCNNLTSDVALDGNCLGLSCLPVETDSTNFILPPVSIRSSNAQTADLPFCDTGEVVLTVKNSSASAHIYDTIITETIHSLSYVANSSVITVTDKDGNIVDGLANIAFEPHTVVSGTDTLLVWSLDYTTTTQHGQILTDRAPEDSIEVVFEVQTDCATPGFNFVRAEAAGLTGCGAFFFRRESAVTLDTIEPIITLTKEGRNVTKGELTYGSPVEAEPGDVVEWRLTANNEVGAYVAQNVVITDTAPSNMSFSGYYTITGGGVVTQTASGVEWNIDNLPADGIDYVIVITGTVTTGSNVCETTTNNARLVYGCDAGCRAQPIDASADLETCPSPTLLLTPATINSCGGELNFSIVNDGLLPAYNVILTDTLPAGYSYDAAVSATNAPDTSPSSGDTAPVWTWTTLPTGTTQVRFLVNSGAGGLCNAPSSGSNVVDIQYEADSSYGDVGPYTDTASSNVTVQQPNLSLTITPSQQDADANQDVTWTVSVYNAGPGVAQGILITDVVSSGFTPTMVSASNGSDADETNTPSIDRTGGFATITWSPAVTIAAGDTWSAVVTATTRNTGINFNEATYSGQCNAGCFYGTDVFTAHVTLLTTFDKSPTVQTGTVGSVVTFTLSASMPDIDALYQNINLTDTLPAGLGFVEATLAYTSDVDGNNNPVPGTQVSGVIPAPNPGQYNSGDVVWNLGDLPGTVRVSGVLTAVIQDASAAYDGATLINNLDMTYLNGGFDYAFHDDTEVDVQEPVLHIGKTYVTPSDCGATLYLENFNNGTSGWSNIGTWNVSNGIYGTSTGGLSVVGDTTWTDYSYSFMMRTSSSTEQIGAIIRQGGGINNTGYRFRWTNGTMYLERLQGGATTLHQLPIGYETNHWYHIEMRAIGNTVEVYIDGVLALSATDSAYVNGRAGFYVIGSNLVQFDDVLVTKMDDMGCYIGANDLVTYTLFISNQWTLPGYDLVITDDLPISTTFVSSSFSSDDGAAVVTSVPPLVGVTGTITWGVNQLTNESPFTGLDHPGITITVVVQVDDGVPANTILPSQVWLAYDGQQGTGPLGIEREYSGGSHSTALRTLPGDLMKTVTFSPQPTATLGTLVTYTIVAPSSPITATLYGVVITDQLQTPRYFIENVTTNGGTNAATAFDQTAGLITATFDSIPHGTQATITVTARISHEFPSAATDPNGGDTVLNNATMRYTTGTTESNVVSTDVHEPLLQISKSAAVNGTDPRAMDYTVTVTNIGDADAFSLNVTDATPGGTTVSNIGQGGALLPDNRTISWTISSLAIGASQNLTYRLTLSEAIYTTNLFTNTAIVTNTSLTDTIPGVRPYVTDTVHTFPLPMGHIGDYVWLDDYSGIQGTSPATETGIANVILNLYNITGTLIATTTTDANGLYIFEYLPLSTTYVVQLAPSNFNIGEPLEPYTVTQLNVSGSTPTNDSDANPDALFGGNGYAITTTLTSVFTEDLSLDYGFVPLMSLGNQVWWDRNNTGHLDAGESTFDGVAVELYQDTNGDGVFSTGDTLLDSTLTAGGGYYTFTELYPSISAQTNYLVVITDTNFTGTGVLVDYLPSSLVDDGNSDRNNWNHGSPVGTVVASTDVALVVNSEPTNDGDTDNNSNLTIDFGFYVMDLGDLPDPTYPTHVASDGARHLISPTLYLGSRVDAEIDGQPNGTADGDDGTLTTSFGAIAGNDEDGVQWSQLVLGQTATFTVTASQNNGYLNGWIDFNGDGDLDDAGEQVFTDLALSTGDNSLSVAVPVTTTLSSIYMRFRYSTQTGLAPTGQAVDGEVEDYVTTPIAYDLGDLPDSYQTTLPLGAQHVISDGLYLGPRVDAEGDGQPNITANGDDNVTGTAVGAGVGDDEDGVIWSTLVVGQIATFTVTASRDNAYLNAWIDFDGDGDFTLASDHVISGVLLNTGVNTFNIPIPLTTTTDNLYMRFRYSTQQVLASNGLAPDGEVEDYFDSPIAYDFGDLPATFPTLLTNNGARHIISSTLYLGTLVDAEIDGQPSVGANGDDLAGSPDDEDGVSWGALIASQTTAFTVTASQNGAYLNGWIDFNANGTFDTGEQVFTDTVLSAGVNSLNVSVPANVASNNNLYMRFRYSTQTGLAPTGEAPDGEVEDYVATLAAYDLGDLPDGLPGASSYPTLLVNSGARHLISPTLYLGNLVDAELNGQPSLAANGDDNNPVELPDDEDGVTWTPLVLGQTATFTVSTASADQGYLNAWIDFNGNGVLDDAGEQVINGVLLNSGDNTFAVTIPATAISDSLYMRFRYSTQQTLLPTGDAPNGEVEDYVAQTVSYDLGDLPDGYGTSLALSGARHTISPTLYLGDRVDAEGDGQPSVNADGDDTNPTTNFGAVGTDDEDGVSWSTLELGQSAVFTVTSASTGAGLVNGWIDFNGNGTFDVGEQIFTDVPLGTGTLTTSVTIPLTATTGNMYMRFRYSTQPNLTPTGNAPDGEVEDYAEQVILRDWGDLPEGPYPVTAANNGARHIILTDGNPTLGAVVDDEADGQPNATATGDDIARTPDDEDGVQLMTPLVAGQVATFTITATNAIDARLIAWMDFNGDGDFADTGELIFNSISLAEGANVLNITVPTIVLSDTINTRFRFSTDAITEPTGEAADGEVEDYQYTPTNLVSLGDLVWFDYNNNGIYESGAGELGVSGVTVELYNAGDTAGTDAPVDTLTTDANGRYLFTDIPEGGYFVHIPPSQFVTGQPLYGYDSTVPTQTDPNTDQNEDVDENGIPVSGTADVAGVNSGVVTVTIGTEPMGEDVDNIDPTTPDANSNLTVDFGFYAANTGITVVKDVTVTPNVNNATVRYTVTVTNSGQIPLFPVVLTDTLPAELTYANNASPAEPDNINGQTLGWDNIVVSPLQPGQATQVGFDAQITAGYTGTFINVVTGTGIYTGGTITDTSSVPVIVRDPAVDLVKAIVPPGAVNGVITYTIIVTNIGVSELDVIPLFDYYDSTYLTFTVSTPMEDYRAPGEIRWNDLTQSFGRNLMPGETFVVTTTFGIIREITQTVNRAVVSGTTDIYTNPAPPVTDTVTITNTPTAVDLLYFTGEQVGNDAVLRWATASEINNYAFYLYRSETDNRDDALEISGGIAAQGVSGGGASYSFTDNTINAGTTYHYWLADMDNSGLESYYGPLQITITADGGIGADFTNWIYLPLIVK